MIFLLPVGVVTLSLTICVIADSVRGRRHA